MKLRTLLAAMLLIATLPCAALAERGNVVVGDYDGDGRTDIVVARQLAGAWFWFIRYANGVETGIPFGLAPSNAPDSLLAGDFDGDGDFEPGVVRSVGGLLFWYALQNDNAASESQWGLAGDTALAGFFGGSGESDRTVVRNLGGALVWYIQNQAPNGISWGLNGDSPYAADLNGDGVDELIVARTEAGLINWYIRDLSGGFTTTASWGLAGDRLLAPSDFNGDGKADLAVTRNFGAFQIVFIRYTDIDVTQNVLFGLSTDTPYVGYFTQSDLAELAVYRESAFQSTHFVRFALADFVAAVPFGLVGDTLVLPEGRGATESAPPAGPAGCTPAAGTATDFLDGAGGGALWKPISEGVANGAPVVLLPIRYCGAQLTVLAADGTEVSGVQRTKCGGNGNRAHFWIARTASSMQPFAPLTVRVVNDGVTECRSVPNPRQRYD